MYILVFLQRNLRCFCSFKNSPPTTQIYQFRTLKKHKNTNTNTYLYTDIHTLMFRPIFTHTHNLWDTGGAANILRLLIKNKIDSLLCYQIIHLFNIWYLQGYWRHYQYPQTRTHLSVQIIITYTCTYYKHKFLSLKIYTNKIQNTSS